MILAAAPPAAVADPAPGACKATRVAETGSRLDGDPASGSAIAYAGGERQVSYRVIPEVAASRPGDPVRLCLVRRPRGCPAGDRRGSIYTAVNLRTGGRWTAGGSEHRCGGA